MTPAKKPRVESTRPEKVVILCGGQGMRMREETEFRPKALVEIGGRPVLWHLMRYYDHFGYRKFVLCLGYRGQMIKEYFLNYHWQCADFTLKLGHEAPTIIPHEDTVEDWEITFVDTGADTQTGGRLARVKHHLEDQPTFLANYCDGLSDVDLDVLVKFHRDTGKIATLTGFHPHSKYGIVRVDEGGVVTYFEEKPLMNDLTSGGFFVFDQRIFDYVTPDADCVLEWEPFRRLAADRQMALHTHHGFWKSMDTFKETQAFNALWNRGETPWKVW